MKKLAVMALIVLMGICAGGNAMANPAEDECVAKCKAAAQLAAEKGDAAFAEINKKDGQFVSENTFVIVFSFEGIVLAHPLKADTIGKNRLADKDSKGKAYYQEYVETAKKGSGWVEHMWTSPDKKEFPKKTYVQRVEGKDMGVAAGYIVK